MSPKIGPTLAFSEQLHKEKYRLPGETFRESTARIAAALKDSDEHFRECLDIMRDMRFLPAGRVQAAMGAPKQVTAYNCFVSGRIEDSFTDGDGSIMTRATESAETMRMGGGIGYNFSGLRPRGALIKKLMSSSSGPISFMAIYDSVCHCIASSGHRRGAQMGVLNVDHPDIEEFITVKHDLSKLTGFNLSIGITDEFMTAVREGTTFDLRFEGRVYKTVDARSLWEMIMRSTWDYAEPGVLFLDTINRKNNLWYCEYIDATNPCGEQPLPPYGACLLGSFNLVRYITPNGIDRRYAFDYEALRRDIPAIVRMMDNVVDRTIYPLEAQRLEAESKRRMGLGVTGVANAIEALGYPYGSKEFLVELARILKTIRDECYRTGVELAKEKGAFKLYSPEYLEGEFIRDLPQDIREGIRAYGIRNSHYTSIAPTGTISFTADYVSSGIEPVFELEGQRIVNMPEGPITVDVSDYGYRVFGVRGKLSSEVTAKEHVAVLSVASMYVDSAVSKTCNVDGSMKWEDFKNIYVTAWENGCKGCTTFNKDGKRMGILLGKVKAEAKGEEPDFDEKAVSMCFIDPDTGERECS